MKTVMYIDVTNFPLVRVIKITAKGISVSFFYDYIKRR